MLYCDACPFKKMVPLDHLVSASPCLAQDFKGCRHFIEAVATAAASVAAGRDPEAQAIPPAPHKEVNPS